MSTGKKTGSGDKKKTSEKGKNTKVKDTATSPYYKAQRKGTVASSLSKRQMSSYFKNVNGNNKRGETEAEHMARMKKREKSNRNNLGY